MKRFTTLAALAAVMVLHNPANAASVTDLAKAHPNWIWPSWAVGEQKAWTIAGLEGGASEALMGIDGTIQPSNRSFSMSYWIYDQDSKKLIAPENLVNQPDAMKWRLQNGYLPIPTTSWKAGEISVFSRLFVNGYGATEDKSITFSQIKLTNSGQAKKNFSLYVAIRPYSVDGKLNPVYKVDYDKTQSYVLVNGKLALIPQTAPNGFGMAAGSQDDISKYALSGTLPAEKSAKDVSGQAGAALKYNVTLAPGESKTLVFKMPMAPKAPTAEMAKFYQKLNANEALTKAVNTWEKRINSTKLSLPDSRYAEAFKASLGYILVDMDGNKLYPGPQTNQFRFRDATYMAYALDVAGRTDVGTNALKYFLKLQQPNGYFPPEVDASGKPVGRKGWDAQGQALFMLGRHYRFTQNEEWLSSVFPAMVKGGDFLMNLRKQAKTPETDRTALDGLLPAGYSGKDLGNEDSHRYWDNCWANGGIYELMWSAYYMNREKLYEKYGSEGNDINGSLSQSYLRVRVKHELMWVPNSPEDIYTPSAALSATPGIWPCRAFNFMDPMVNQSFLNYYWDKWVKPNDGGYFLDGKYLAHASLGLAHSYLYFDHPERALPVVERAILNQAGSGVYAWAEGSDPQTGKVYGDMPGGWAAAEYINVLRDMLVREEREGLTLFSGISAGWLDDGKVISFQGMPTYWGKLGMTFTSHADKGYATIKFSGDANPPAGIMIRWPENARPARGMIVDGKIYTQFSSYFISLPSGVKDVKIEF